jgi:hypothetical protein
MRRYSGLNIEDPLGQGMITLHFVTNSWPDISKKLKKKTWKDKNLDDLLRRGPKGLCEMDEKQKNKPEG